MAKSLAVRREEGLCEKLNKNTPRLMTGTDFSNTRLLWIHSQTGPRKYKSKLLQHCDILLIFYVIRFVKMTEAGVFVARDLLGKAGKNHVKFG